MRLFQVPERAGQARAAVQEPGHGVQRAHGAKARPALGHDLHQGLRTRRQGHRTQTGKSIERVGTGPLLRNRNRNCRLIEFLVLLNVDGPSYFTLTLIPSLKVV